MARILKANESASSRRTKSPLDDKGTRRTVDVLRGGPQGAKTCVVPLAEDEVAGSSGSDDYVDEKSGKRGRRIIALFFHSKVRPTSVRAVAFGDAG